MTKHYELREVDVFAGEDVVERAIEGMRKFREALEGNLWFAELLPPKRSIRVDLLTPRQQLIFAKWIENPRLSRLVVFAASSYASFSWREMFDLVANDWRPDFIDDYRRWMIAQCLLHDLPADLYLTNAPGAFPRIEMEAFRVGFDSEPHVTTRQLFFNHYLK